MSGTEVTFKAKGITLSDEGAAKAREYLEAQGSDVAVAGLRVGVKGGGCSGFQYQLAFDEQRENDITFEDKGLRLEIDFVDSLQGAGFQVNNPNVVAACGCGSSFQVKDEEEAVSAL